MDFPIHSINIHIYNDNQCVHMHTKAIENGKYEIKSIFFFYCVCVLLRSIHTHTLAYISEYIFHECDYIVVGRPKRPKSSNQNPKIWQC